MTAGMVLSLVLFMTDLRHGLSATTLLAQLALMAMVHQAYGIFPLMVLRK
jgi:hypothetical protein